MSEQASITSLASRKDDRVVWEFDLPPDLVALEDKFVKKSIGLVKLKMGEEVTASERAGSNQAKLAYNWARFALVEVDGRRLNKADGEDETVLEHTDPQIRELILAAYADISSNNKANEKKFLASKKMKTP